MSTHSIEDINLDNINLGTPYTIQGGAYFSKINLDGGALIIQTPKSETKNGIKKTGKRMYCDLKFNLDDNEYYEWYEKLEEKVKHLIFDHKKEWFHEDITLEEIEYNWNTALRSYKTNFYLFRTLIDKSKIINDYDLKIWSEDEKLLNLEDFNVNSKIISIVEIKGLKFTSQSFSLDCVLKQIMVLKEKKQQNICLIKRNLEDLENRNEVSNYNLLEDKPNVEEVKEKVVGEVEEEVVGEVVKREVEEEVVGEVVEREVEEEVEEVVKREVEEEVVGEVEEVVKGEVEEVVVGEVNKGEVEEVVNGEVEEVGEEEKKDLEKAYITEGSLEKGKDLEEKDMIEINLELPEDLEKNVMKLKKPNEVYYKMYKNARGRRQYWQKN